MHFEIQFEFAFESVLWS